MNDERFPAFLHAVEKATAYLKLHPDLMWQAFAKSHPELNNTFNQRAWQKTMPYFADKPAAIDKHAYQAYADFLYQHKLTKKPITINQYANFS